MGASLHSCCDDTQLVEKGSGMGGLLRAKEELELDALHALMLGEVDITTGCDCSHPQRVLTEPLVPRDPNARLEALIQELFCLQDLNSDGVLDESELVILNQKIAVLHYGQDVDIAAVRRKYKNVFREHLDANGCPVPVAIFRRYVLQVLCELDPDPVAQDMILEQFTIEARIAREIFWNTTDTAAVLKFTSRQVLTVCGPDDVREVQCSGDLPRRVSDMCNGVSMSPSSVFSA